MSLLPGRGLREVVQVQPSGADQGDGSGLQNEETTSPTCVHRGGRCWGGQDLQISGAAAGCQAGLDSKCEHFTQERAEPSVLPEKAGVLQHLQKTAADVLPVRGGQCPLLCCGLLGRKQQEERRWLTGQTGEESWLSCGHRAGLSGDSGRKNDPRQTAVHTGQHLHQAEECVQWQAAVPVQLHPQTQKLFRPPGHQTVQQLSIKAGRTIDNNR